MASPPKGPHDLRVSSRNLDAMAVLAGFLMDLHYKMETYSSAPLNLCQLLVSDSPAMIRFDVYKASKVLASQPYNLLKRLAKRRRRHPSMDAWCGR